MPEDLREKQRVRAREQKALERRHEKGLERKAGSRAHRKLLSEVERELKLQKHRCLQRSFYINHQCVPQKMSLQTQGRLNKRIEHETKRRLDRS